MDLEALAARARNGDRDALESLVVALKDDVYGLALRMLWHPQDAEDATQEILVRVVTRLATFRGESAFRTWVFRVAANHLLNARRGRAEVPISFDQFAGELGRGLADRAPGPDSRLLEEEVKIGCTTGMLLCLDRDHRLAYVLGEIVGLDSGAAAVALDIEPAAFRKRLQRSRERLQQFMAGHCGLLNASAPCRCAKRIDGAIAAGRVDPRRLLFATHAVRRAVERLDELRDAASVYRSHPDYAAPDGLVARVRAALP
jgi:RNA polymerase sigma factor (sigma-70 family)